MAVLSIAAATLVEAQTLQTLYFFNYGIGATPRAGLTLGNDGQFYGTTGAGGFYGGGSIFRVTTNGTLTALLFFNFSNGSDPHAALAVGDDGHFYGTTFYSSTSDGTLFRTTTNGILSTLVYFSGTNGAFPASELAHGNDGCFYGTTSQGGSYGQGTIYRVSTNGALFTLVSFNGDSPRGALAFCGDGNFYGTTFQGRVFRVTTNGAFTTIATFPDRTNGAYPQAGLTLGIDGNFYGTTRSGGTTDNGVVFKVATNGTLTTLVSFDGTNGANPEVALTLGRDGNFYGTTTYGGASNYGTVFIVTTNGLLATLVSFVNTNGAYPRGLTLGNDGNFYGTTGGGSNNHYGTVFRLSLPPVIILVQPRSQTKNAGDSVTFQIVATSPLPMSFQWQQNGTNLVDGGKIMGSTTNVLTITGISANDEALYSVIVSNTNGSVTNFATLTVIDPPTIAVEPANALVLPGGNAAFGVSVSGTAPLGYQWRFNGTDLSNATNASYAITSVTTNKAGNYSVVITNQAGSVTSSNAALTVVLSPASRTNYASSTATFTTTAVGPEPVNYQWQKNGTNLPDGGNISGSTSRTLTIASVSDADSATYRAVVSQGGSSVTTSNALLTVNNFPFLASQPQSQTVVAGSTATFSVTAYGAPPFVFQWHFNGSPVGAPSGGTNVSIFTLTNVGTNQAGNYSVQVINGYSSLMSSDAMLMVILPPSLGLKLTAGYPLLNLHGRLNNNYVVQYNTNLVESNWINLLSVTNLPVSPYQFLDPAGSGQPARFYRAFMQ